MPHIPNVPTCEGCSCTEETVEGMVSLRKGGMPTFLCFGCIEGLMVRVETERKVRGWRGSPTFAGAAKPGPTYAHARDGEKAYD